YTCLGRAHGGETGARTSDRIEPGSCVAAIAGKDVALRALANDAVRVSLTQHAAALASAMGTGEDPARPEGTPGADTADELTQTASNYDRAIVGRYVNRIGNPTSTLSGTTYELEKNAGENSLHGGTNGVYNKVWTVEQSADTAITLAYTSPDGEAGY